MNSIAKNIEPYVEKELVLATQLYNTGESRSAFSHLESAHIIGLFSTYFHLKTHLQSLKWASAERKFGERVGQFFRILGAATNSLLALYLKTLRAVPTLVLLNRCLLVRNMHQCKCLNAGKCLGRMWLAMRFNFFGVASACFYSALSQYLWKFIRT